MWRGWSVILFEKLPHLERGHHLALFFAVYQVIVVLHRNEGRKAIVDRVICLNANNGSFFESTSQARVASMMAPTLHLMDWWHIKEV